jgi:hypothetical protein
MINSTIRPKLRPMVQEVLEILCASELSIVPKNLQFKYKSLREIGPKEQEEINVMKQGRFLAGLEAGIIEEKELAEKFERHNLV